MDQRRASTFLCIYMRVLLLAQKDFPQTNLSKIHELHARQRILAAVFLVLVAGGLRVRALLAQLAPWQLALPRKRKSISSQFSNTILECPISLIWPCTDIL